MGPRIIALLFTDLAGRPIDTLDDAIFEGQDVPEHRERSGMLLELLNDPAEEPYDRFLACYALTCWAQPAGYRSVIEAAARSSDVIWHKAVLDKQFPVDATFALLARATWFSEDLARELGTEPDRLAAIRALIDLVDHQYFDWQLSQALDDDTLPHVIDALPPAIRAGFQVLVHGPQPAFDLHEQLRLLIVTMLDGEAKLASQLLDELPAAPTP